MYPRLQQLAKRADVSLYALADEAGLERATVYQLGRRTHGNPTTLNLLCRALAKRLEVKPSEVYAELTGIDEGITA
jgi:DNA-binding XRE family transcriptional regulator